jgi:Ca2+-binding EF-hand superfamily protein
MIRTFDVNNSGSITYEEFHALHSFVTNAQSTFMTASGGVNNRITANQLRQLLSTSGYNLDVPAFNTVALIFDPDKDGECHPMLTLPD